MVETCNKAAAGSPPYDCSSFLAYAGVDDLPLAREWLCRKLKVKGARQQVVTAFRTVPRHAFAPPNRWRTAYLDLDLWTGITWMTSPLVVARMVSAIPVVGPGTRIYEIGTGTGFQSSILGAMGADVITVDTNPDCTFANRLRIEHLKLANIRVQLRDGIAYPPSGEKFDAVLVNAALTHYGETLLSLLKPGGILVAPVILADGTQRLVRYCVPDDTRPYLSTANLGVCKFIAASTF
jgi:protein-L-isoaspartate(D-aspartate) O-methyltransferase